MDRLEELKKDALEELKERIIENPDAEHGDYIFEITDSYVPIHYYDILKMASENMNLALDEPELGPAFDGKPTPVNIIAANIFEEIHNHLWSELDNLKEEIEEEKEECSICGDRFFEDEEKLIEVGDELQCDSCYTETVQDNV
jgi:hypothetical protein